VEHHAHPSTHEDPDYHEGAHGFWGWYARFLWKYSTLWQWIAMAAVFNLLLHGVGLSLGQLWLYWLGPQIVSTIQLFAVGTYWPHRQGPFEGHGPTRARTLALPTWLSFLACFHFGYHYEHHASPWVPWWRLPAARRLRRQNPQL
jgi:beta-carotene ketolase (CrtW type)